MLSFTTLGPLMLAAASSSLFTLTSAAPAAAAAQVENITPVSARDLAARGAWLSGHAKVYVPPNGMGGELYMDLVAAPSLEPEGSPCTISYTLPYETQSCVCTVQVRPIWNSVTCTATIVPDSEQIEPGSGAPSSIKLSWFGSYLFSNNGISMNVNTKPLACSPNCNGVKITP